MIKLLQYDGSDVAPKDDAILYDFLVQDSGILSGCAVTHLGAGQLQIADGRGIIMGRNFVVQAQTIQATLAESGTLSGRLLIQIDIANSEEPISFVTQAQASLPDLVQEDINGSGSIFQLPLAIYTAEVTQISGLTSVAHILDNTVLPASKGGTGQTSLQAARNAMGLGNTLGVLPVANGGTGQSSLANVTVGNAMEIGGVSSDKVAYSELFNGVDIIDAIKSKPDDSCGIFRSYATCTGTPVEKIAGFGYWRKLSDDDLQIEWNQLENGASFSFTRVGGEDKGWYKVDAGTWNNMKNWKGTQVQYDGLSVKDSNTVYFIVG